MAKVAITKYHSVAYTTKIYFTIILEARSPGSTCQQVWFGFLLTFPLCMDISWYLPAGTNFIFSNFVEFAILD